MKTCPFCNSELEDNAQKCKNCGEWVNKIVPERNFGPTVAFAFFFGIFGVHRFYTGYKKIGIIQLCLTLTLFGLIISSIWVLIDTLSIALNKYKDSQGRNINNYNKVFGIAIAIIAVLAFLCNFKNAIDGANMTDTSNNNQVHQVKSEKQNNKLEVLEHKSVVEDYGTHYIVGTIKNNTNKNYSYAEVDINLYDRNGTLVDSTMDNINNLEPYGVWKFKAVVTEDNVASYKIKEVSGY